MGASTAYADAVAALGRQAQRTLAWTPAFQDLHEAGAAGPVTAVDGSHAVLVDNGSVWVVAHRAHALAWPGPAHPIAPIITAVTPEGGARLAGRPIASAEGLAVALRERAETAALRATVEAAPAGALVLADGALHGLPGEQQDTANALRELAFQRGVSLVGVAKRSGLERDGVALVPALHALRPEGRWAVHVGDGTFVARLHAAASMPFRVDARTVADVARLLPLCRDAAYPGYPYPLAKVHNQVAFTAGAVAELKAGLERALRQDGGSAALHAVADFHDVLDRNVAG